MALSDAVREITADLRMMPGVLSVPGTPPDDLNEWPALIVYPQPGQAVPDAHATEAGNPTFRTTDDLIVRWMSMDADLPRSIERATTALDSMREALFAGFRRDRFNGSVTRLLSVTGGTFDLSDWGSDRPFLVELIVQIELHEEIV